MLNAAADVRWVRGRLSPLPHGRARRRSYRIPVGTIVRAPLESLRPTQAVVGMGSVSRKLEKLERRALEPKRLEKTLMKRPIPAEYGPDGGFFIVDHHHFGLALCRGEFESAYVHVIADAAELPRAAFWNRMQAEGRVYLFDERGERIPPSLLPASLSDLRHDPFRDFALYVRQAGGFGKAHVPYAEFRWANFFRKHMEACVIASDPKDAIRKALKLCKSKDASVLPGFLY